MLALIIVGALAVLVVVVAMLVAADFKLIRHLQAHHRQRGLLTC